jgi:hypothetical protein
MNSLLLTLVMSATTIAPINQTPQLSVDRVASLGSQCSQNQVYMGVYYYEYPGGPSCGLTYIYCNKPQYHDGCTTNYFNEYEYCWCP